MTSFAEDKDEVNSAANTVTIRGNDTSVRVEGNTGKIRTLHFEQDDDDDDDDEEDEEEDFSDDNEGVLTFQVDSLQEIDAAGNPVGMRGSSSARTHGLTDLVNQIQSYTFQQLENSTTYQGIPVKRVNLSVVLAGTQANLKMIVFLFLRAGIIHFGNETFRVQSGTLKFNIEVSFRYLLFSMLQLCYCMYGFELFYSGPIYTYVIKSIPKSLGCSNPRFTFLNLKA